jgi:hypothetical protein
MARVVDFNINNAKTTPTNTSSCSVVINNVKQSTNNPGNPSQFPQQVVYPEIPNDQFQSVSPNLMTRSANL